MHSALSRNFTLPDTSNSLDTCESSDRGGGGEGEGRGSGKSTRNLSEEYNAKTSINYARNTRGERYICRINVKRQRFFEDEYYRGKLSGCQRQIHFAYDPIAAFPIKTRV